MGLGSFRVALVLIAAAALPALGQNQPEQKLSAREIFYSAPKVAANQPQTSARKPAPKAAPAEPEPEIATTKPRPKEPKPITPRPADAPEPQFIPVSQTEMPLGIRCSLLKLVGPSDVVEMDSEGVFHSGDRIRLRVETSDDGYLYVIHRGSSGVWKPLFPSAEVKNGNNWVAAGTPHDVPQGYVFTFDEQPGEEKLFVVFSRAPVGDLEDLIYDLKSRKPAAPAEPGGSSKVLLAQNLIDINDGVVDRLRNTYARDLIIERVDDTQPTDKYGKETAVYAVSATSNADSRVVVDLSLEHR